MEIAEFLLARIAEDEARVADKRSRPHWGDIMSSLGDECDCDLPTRVLAECAAKRWGVELARDDDDDEWVLRLLALPYAGHPDYRWEWRI